MKILVLVCALLLGASAVHAQTVPDLKGTWVGKGKSVVFGTNPHHPGAPPNDVTPRVREVEFTVVVAGQDGRLAWGHSSSSVAATRDPFAWAMTSDNKTIIGSDTDGSYYATVLSADRMEICYTHSGLSPSKSVVAACYLYDRKK